MARKQARSVASPPARRYRSPNIPLAAIRRFARQVAERFQPDRIILFGSYAYGTPHPDSDVDLLVVMPAANEINQAVRIRLALEAPFPMDLIVMTPAKLRRRLADGNWFAREVLEKGKVLHEKRDLEMGPQDRGGLQRRPKSRSGTAAT